MARAKKLITFKEKTEISKAVNGVLTENEDGRLIIVSEDGEAITLDEVYSTFIGMPVAITVKNVIERDLENEPHDYDEEV